MEKTGQDSPYSIISKPCRKRKHENAGERSPASTKKKQKKESLAHFSSGQSSYQWYSAKLTSQEEPTYTSCSSAREGNGIKMAERERKDGLCGKGQQRQVMKGNTTPNPAGRKY